MKKRIMASQQMLKSLLPSAKRHHLARSILCIKPDATLYRNKFWANTMEADILMYDFQDGCPPKDYPKVMEGLKIAHEVYPNKEISVRVTELERDDGSRIYNEMKATMKQKQVLWFVLPLCNSVDDVKEYIDIINKIDANWLSNHGGLKFICETPKGLRNLDEILDTIPEIKGVFAGAVDYFRFAQGKPKQLLPFFRWDVLNACLCHGRFPIDAPPLSLSSDENDEVFGWHIQSALDSGLRSIPILHPKQTEIVNTKLSPTAEDVASAQMHVPQWLETRETGYRRGSGDDFMGPPHMKQKTWLLRYDTEIKAKKTTHTQSVSPMQTKKLKSLLKQVITPTNNGNSIDESELDVMGFIALSCSYHPRHEDLIANLGYSNVVVDTSEASLDDAAYVCKQTVCRKGTSSGCGVIVTHYFEVLDDEFGVLSKMIMRLMEKPLPYDNYINEDIAPHTLSLLPQTMKDKAEINKIMEGSTLLEKESFVSPDVNTHHSYCELLGLDAPLHHTDMDHPTIPSTIHLFCHQVDCSHDPNNTIHFSDVTYHSEMKPSTTYIRSKYQLPPDQNGNSKLFLSIIEDDGGKLLSSVFYER